MILNSKSSNGYYNVQLTLTEGKYSIEDNTSPVSYKLEILSGSNAHFSQMKIGRSINIDGKSVVDIAKDDSGQFSLGYNSSVTIASGTVDIEHDNDGSKKIAVSFIVEMTAYSYTTGTVKGSGSMQLTTIPRKATVSVVTNFNDESNPVVTFSNPGGFELSPYLNVWVDGEIIHSIKKSKGKYSSPYTFALTNDERTALRKACNTDTVYDGVTVGFTTHFSANSTDYHSKYTTFSIVNADPIFDASKILFQDVDDLTIEITGNNQVIVQNKSLLNVACGTAEALKGATISKYHFELNGVKKTLNSAVGGTVEMGLVAVSGTLQLKVTAEDSRGNTTTAIKEIDVVPYNKPSIALHSNYGLIICKRCDANGVIDDKGTCLKLVIQGGWSSLLNGENSAKMEIQFTTTDYESAWIKVEAETQGGGVANKYLSWYDVNNVIADVYLNLKRAYIVTVKCTDLFGEYSDISFKIPTEDVTFHLKNGGNGAAFGGYSTEEKVLDLHDWRLKYFGAYMNDIISETGESGMWNYIKLANGYAVCWGTALVENTAFTTAWGDLYYADIYLSAVNYPFEFAERPQELVTARTDTGAVWIYTQSISDGGGMNSTTKTASYNVCRPKGFTTEQNIYYDFLVIGKIKTEE